MLRESERQFSSSLRHIKLVETYAYLARVYIRLDQPLSAIGKRKSQIFRDIIHLYTNKQRYLLIHVSSALGDLSALQAFCLLVTSRVRGPQSKIVANELHDQRTVLVRAFVQRVQVDNRIIKRLK